MVDGGIYDTPAGRLYGSGREPSTALSPDAYVELAYAMYRIAWEELRHPLPAWWELTDDARNIWRQVVAAVRMLPKEPL